MRHGSDPEPFGIPSRRTVLRLIGASMLTGLSGCTTNHTVRNKPDDRPTTPAQPSNHPTRSAFVPDFTLPPVQHGLAPVITRIPTALPVVFLTIDDGITKTPEMVRLMNFYGYPATLFLAKNFIRDNPSFFKGFAGSLIENHTVSHNTNMVKELDYAGQSAEIKGMQDYAQEQYGRRPVLFRPPGGPYSTVMRKAVADAGLKAIIDWRAKADAGHMDYQTGSALQAGDIVLMHFRPEFAADLKAFRQAHQSAGLEVVLLQDFLRLQ